MKNLAGFYRAAIAAFVLAAAFASALVFSPSGAASRALVGTNIVVNSTSDDERDDDGLCTLREAITSANSNTASGVVAGECAAGTGDDTITFNVTGTVNLEHELPNLSSNVTINGPGAKLLTVRRDSGGHYRIFTVASAASVQISGLTVSNGQTPNGADGPLGGNGVDGGGINNSGTLTLTTVTVSGNRTGNGGNTSTSDKRGGNGGQGGGVYNSGTLTLADSTISGNQTGSGGNGGGGTFGTAGDAGDGGGLYVKNTLTATNSTFSGNQSRGGGGIWLIVTDVSFTARLTNCTIADNVASINGTGVTSFAATTVGNTIIAHNIGAGADASGGFVSQGHNVVGTESGNSLGTPSFTQPTDKVGTENARLDPLLGPLADNGGQTQTHALLAGSPALEAGDNSLAVDANNNALTTDQRGTGFPRVADSADADTTQTVDIGAFEAYPSVEDITDKSTGEDSTLSFNFNVGDAALDHPTVTAASSNTSLVPNDSAHINVTGTGSQRTLNITPAPDANGNATVTVTAAAGNGRTATDTFLLTVTPANDQPTGVALSNNVVADNSPANATVGTLSTTDPDAGDTFTYSLVAGAGSIDNGSFAVSGSTLKTAAVIDYETKRAYSVRVRTTDSGGLSFEKVFLVNVSDGPDNTGALSFSAANYNVSEAGGSATITLRRTGGADNRVYAKVSPTDVTTSPADYRFSPGTLDTTFNGSGSDTRAIALQPDGKIIVGTKRLNPDGSLDNAFNVTTGVNGFVRTATLQPDGRVIFGANFTLARFNSDGSLDNTFNAGIGLSINDGPDYRVFATALQPDGKILVAGFFNTPNGFAGIARLNADGSLDNTFTPSLSEVFSVAVQPDGKVLVEGTIRLNSDGSVDNTFDTNGGANSVVRAIAIQPDGKIIIGGDFTMVGGVARNGVARLNSNGSLDNTFNPGAGVSGSQITGVHTLFLQPDGKVFIGGDFTFFNGTQRNYLARLNSDGSLDTTFNPGTGANNVVRASAMQPDGKIIIGGSFTDIGGTARNGVARLYGDLFATWEAGDSSDKTVSLPIVNDALPEQNETLALSLNAFGASAGSPPSATLTINEDDTVVSSVSGSGVYGGTGTLSATLTLAGSPLSGKTIIFFFGSVPVGTATTDTSGVATLTGVSLGLFNAGTDTSTLGATFEGGSGLSASGAIGVLTIAKASQTINFGALADKTYDGGQFQYQLSATASSGLSVSYNASGNCVISSGTFVRITGAGTCTVTASQAGNINYNAAADVVRTFNIAKATTTTTITSSVNPSAVGQDVTFTVKVTSAAGTPSGSVHFDVQGGGSGVIHDDGVNPVVFGVGGLTAGTHTVDASFDGNDNFAPSSTSLAGGQVVGALFEFSQSSYSVAEGSSLTVTVRRLGDTTQAASVDYATDDGSTPSVVVPCSSVTGLALDRCDFTKALGTLRFAAGETEKTFIVLGSDDSYTEGSETAGLKLSNPSSNGVLGAGSVAAFTINDDSPESAGNPADDDEKFITQHYRDFLNRDPDASGLAFWKSQITSCGLDAQCREVKRVNVSAAFFLSIEFQQTGYFVYKTYKVAYGDATSPGVTGTVPVIRLNEFLPDTQRIGQGVVVGQGDWQRQLGANQVAFMLEFVQRLRFMAAFPASMPAEQFVDKVAQNAGATLSQSEHEYFVGYLNFAPSDPTRRAEVFRGIMDAGQVHATEYNRAFVLMEYFGYLRRNPDDSPEATLNFAGWKFWLDKLNSFDGNYIKAEMVKAFISSDEYRHRFGQ